MQVFEDRVVVVKVVRSSVNVSGPLLKSFHANFNEKKKKRHVCGQCEKV